MTILVSGSLAYDTIMVFPDQFKKHILADQIHILNVAFMVPDMRREYGGTAGNIAYNLKLLGEEPWIMATVGHDFAPYAQRLERLGLSTRHVRVLDGQFTATQFYADVDGHPSDRPVKNALEELAFFSAELRVLGVYPASSFREKVK